jgi:hypothetical protein
MMSAQDTPQVAENNRHEANARILAAHEEQLAEHATLMAQLDEDALVAIISRPAEELAVALYMSDMPDRRPKGDTWTLAQLAEWVSDGINTLEGHAQAWHTAYRSQQAAKAGDWMAYHLFWDDSRREKTARQAAAQITASGKYDYQLVLVTVVIASCDQGCEWSIDVDARDVRYAARLGVVLR